jgi:hypothetical protein
VVTVIDAAEWHKLAGQVRIAFCYISLGVEIRLGSLMPAAAWHHE